MTPADMARIHAAAFPNRRVWSVAEFQDFLTDPGVSLATTNHGFALGRIIAQEMEVLTVAVDPDHQGQGQGRALVRDLLAAAKSTADTAFLEVSADNQPAMALYASLGFAAVGRRKNYYAGKDGTSADALVLRLDLSV